ncbi:MAG: Gfo/Idh/MocA family oxidoreductase [Alphaproteobacteria bacterium]
MEARPITRVTVIGLGSIGSRHARNLRGMGVSVTGFDPDIQRRATATASGITTFPDRESALAVADAAIIASPTPCHIDDLAAAIESNCHALVEKPLGHRSDLLPALLDVAEDKKLIVAGAHNLRFRATVEKAKTIINDGQLGELFWARFLSASYLPDWRTGQKHITGYAANPVSGGVIFDAIHELDLAQYLLGDGAVAAAAATATGRLGIQSDDIADIVLQHVDGARSAIHLDYLTRPRRRRIEIIGANGILEADLRTGWLRLADRDDREIECIKTTLVPNEEYIRLVTDFLSAATMHRPPACPAREALAVLALALNARSLSGLPTWETSGQPIDVH